MSNHLAIGAPFLGRQGPSPEGVQLVMGGGPQLQLFLPKLTPEEIHCIQNGPAHFGVHEVAGVLFFLYRFDPAIPWSDTPYHRALEEAVRPVALPRLEGPESRLLLQVVLVRCEDSRVAALRTLSLPPHLSRALLAAVAAQGPLPPDYDERIARAYARFPRTKDLLEGAITGKGGT